ncbi:MAG TPA: MraY family glycosyltransferase, partial [Thermomicrobiales bacterium]|nr:MraY family glycosyltransferase [Thermomicrobiales bacterium]
MPAAPLASAADIPAGPPVDAATQAAVETTLRDVVACGNAGDFSRRLALFTDRFARQLGPPPGVTADVARAALATPQPVPAADAAGIVAIGAGAFALYSHHLFDLGLLPNESNSISPLVAVIVVGMCVGFLPWNFHPARIFMGDSGALLLGLLMASSTLLVGGQTAESTSGTTYFFFAPLVIPLVILGVPIVDTAFSIVRRAAKRTSVSVADKDHLHHRLM